MKTQFCFYCFSLCVFFFSFSVFETKTETLGPSLTSFKISDLLFGRTYIFTIRPLYGVVEGPVSTVYQRIRKTSLTLLESMFGWFGCFPYFLECIPSVANSNFDFF